jgi:hypothetical protein
MSGIGMGVSMSGGVGRCDMGLGFIKQREW